MKQKFLIVMLFLSITAIAQVGVQTNDPKATMDITALKGTVADGLLVPRLTAEEVKEMTEASPKKINTNQNSLLVYVTAPFSTTPTTNKEKYDLITSKGFYYYDAYDNGGNGKWKKLYDSNTTLSSGGGGKVYLPGAGITFTGSDKNEITASGLERVTQTNNKIGDATISTQTNTGWRYIGMNKNNYGPIGKWATDLQYIPNSNEESKIAFHYFATQAYPAYGTPAMAESKTYAQLKGEIGQKYGTASRTSFDYSKVGAIGDHSLAGGVYNIVGAPIGVAFGYGNRSTGIASFVSGQFNDVKGDKSFVAGENNTVDFDAKESFVMGVDNTVNSRFNTAIGRSNEFTADAESSFALGEKNNIGSKSAVALGSNNKAEIRTNNSILIGDQCKAFKDANNSIVIGKLSTSRKSNSILIGNSNRSEVTSGIAIGSTNTVTYQNAILVGSNLTSSRNYQFVCGQNNKPDSEAAFILGGGDAGNLLVVKNAEGKKGDLHALGNIFAGEAGTDKAIWASHFNRFSDIRLKKDIENLPVNSDVLSQLRPVQYYWKEGDNNTLQYGFIAQEIEKIFPNLVSTNTQGEKYKSVDYDGLIPVLTKVLQEKSAEIASQKEEIASLKAQLQAEKERNDAQEARLKAIEAKLK